MHEYETIPKMICDNPPTPEDPYTYYAGHPATAPVPRYVPKQKKKKHLYSNITGQLRSFRLLFHCS